MTCCWCWTLLFRWHTLSGSQCFLCPTPPLPLPSPHLCLSFPCYSSLDFHQFSTLTLLVSFFSEFFPLPNSTPFRVRIVPISARSHSLLVPTPCSTRPFPLSNSTPSPAAPTPETMDLGQDSLDYQKTEGAEAARKGGEGRELPHVATNQPLWLFPPSVAFHGVGFRVCILIHSHFFFSLCLLIGMIIKVLVLLMVSTSELMFLWRVICCGCTGRLLIPPTYAKKQTSTSVYWK